MNQRNILFKISYDGSHFYGSQKQPGKKTVQSVLEEKISRILNEKIKLTFSSRTDRGVHALGNYLSFKTQNPLPLHKLYTLNRGLKHINIRKIYQVNEDFSARYNTLKKTYMYVINNTKYKNPLYYDYSWTIQDPLDIEKLKEASKIFLGTHNFSAFSKRRFKDENTERTISNIKVVAGSNKIRLFITGNGFLYNMVRIMVYSLHLVGRDTLTSDRLKKMLVNHNDYTPLGKALPGGLYLMNVYYNDDDLYYIRRKQ